jgi:hypothetical protein
LTVEYPPALKLLFRHKITYEYIYENDDFTEVLRWTKFKFNYQDLGEVNEVFQMLGQFEILDFSSLNMEENEEELISGILKIEEILGYSLLFFHQKIESNEYGYYWNFEDEIFLTERMAGAIAVVFSSVVTSKSIILSPINFLHLLSIKYVLSHQSLPTAL